LSGIHSVLHRSASQPPVKLRDLAVSLSQLKLLSLRYRRQIPHGSGMKAASIAKLLDGLGHFENMLESLERSEIAGGAL